jgi:serine/threonine-protein kinase
LDQPEARAIPNAEDAVAPAFSPDGAWLAFSTRNAIKKVSVRGGPASTICKIDGWTNCMEWGSDDTIVFSTFGGGLYRVRAAGGEAQELAPVEEDSELLRVLPHFLPDGSGILFTQTESRSDWEKASIMALTFGDTEPEEVLLGGSDARVLPTGHLIFRKVNTLLAAPFDPQSRRVTGPAVPVLENVAGQRLIHPAQLDTADDGTLVYAVGGSEGSDGRELAWIDENGVIAPASKSRADYGWHALSPDGSLVAVQATDDDDEGDENIFILERERDLLRRLTSDPADDGGPVWTPDGQWIVFASERDGKHANLYRVRADFSGAIERLSTSEHRQWPLHVSPDGKALLYSQRQGGDRDIYLVHLSEAGQPEGDPVLLAGGPGNQPQARFSPDGQWVAYLSNEAGEMNVYVKAASGEGAAVLVSTEGGNNPRWSPVEKKLFYTRNFPVRHMFHVTYTDESGAFRASLPQEMFELSVSGFVGPGFEIEPDGKRFSVVIDGGSSDATAMPRIILNWFEQLREMAPLDPARGES